MVYIVFVSLTLVLVLVMLMVDDVGEEIKYPARWVKVHEDEEVERDV